MTTISLRELIDDILLLVRNNNISESEDLSRAQITSWIKAHKYNIWRERLDKIKEKAESGRFDIEDLVDDMVLKLKEVGPLELEDVESKSDIPTHTKRTIDPLKNIFNNNWTSILAIHDQQGENIQYMDHIRRHYHYHRKYTYGDMTAYYLDDGHVYIQGLVDENKLQYIYVLAVYEMDDSDGEGTDDGNDPDEEDVKIPGWMVPTIKDRILKNELSFMLNRPSDDSNNATLASVKPHGPQDDEE